MRGYTVDTDDVFDLLAAQRRLSIRLLALILIPVGLLPMLFRFAPDVARWSPLGHAPFAWLILGPIALFSIVAIAIWHERRAMRIENRWRDAKGHG